MTIVMFQKKSSANQESLIRKEYQVQEEIFAIFLSLAGSVR
jgi:hypothetical protein